MQMGRFDELGSGILNINKYCKAYSGQNHPEFIEGPVFKTIIPPDDKLVNPLTTGDRINDALTDRINNLETGLNTDASDTGDRILDSLSDRINQVRGVNDRIKNENEVG